MMITQFVHCSRSIPLIIDLSAQTLPSNLIWNENETGYYEIKDNNIVLVDFETANQQIILNSDEIGEINIESFSFSRKKQDFTFYKLKKYGASIQGVTIGFMILKKRNKNSELI